MKRILIIDDEDPIREVLQRVLAREGYKVEGAENGAVAERMVQEAVADNQPFDLLLLDVHMPVMDGITLHRRLTEQGICPKTIVVTGDPHGERIQAMMADQHTSLLEKPFRAQSAIQAVEKALS